MPRPMTNDWYRIGAEAKYIGSEETPGSAEANEALVPNDSSNGLGGAKGGDKESNNKSWSTWPGRCCKRGRVRWKTSSNAQKR